MWVCVCIVACTHEPVLPAEEVPDSSYGLLYQKILKPGCALSGCHATEGDNSYVQHGLAFTGAAATYSRLINGSVKDAQALTAGLKQVVPGDTLNSFLFQKINFDKATHAYGLSMPIGADPLTPFQVLFVQQWILAGAPETGHVADKTLLP
ncbi:MAG: hypothetical protein EAZ89_04940 [Bacteroidetes bacterium]|nr:MAG: hypothetical protein EAZ89_04940 [Bacteroidota bacterium]